jgi:hypothetical protein
MQDATPTTIKQYQCRHIFTDGRRCASPCLRQEEFCYYHHTTRRPVADPRQRRSRRSTFDLPHPEDRSAIQSSIGEVLRRIASNDIDPRRAGLLLYGLQIASINLPRPSRTARQSRYSGRTIRDEEDIPETTLVEEIVIDPKLGTVAPRAEVVEKEEHLSIVGQLLRDFDRQYGDEEEREEAEGRSEALAAQPPALEQLGEATQNPRQTDAILPTLQATATTPHKARHCLHRRGARHQNSPGPAGATGGTVAVNSGRGEAVIAASSEGEIIEELTEEDEMPAEEAGRGKLRAWSCRLWPE